jgi:protein involved in polysaccharide export with SLBB domain
LANELHQYLRRVPAVAITLRAVQSKEVWLLGRINHPGVYPLAGPTTLLEALSEAGGPSSASGVAALSGALGISSIGSTSEAADLSHSFVIRHGRVLPVDFEKLLREGDLSQNIYLEPDDFVYLPSSGIQVVYVLGAVLQPRAVNFSGQPTLIQTIASAGGTIKDAYISQVAIVRGSLAQPEMALVDYHAVARGQAPDVALQPGDIVYVPFSPYRTPLRYANLILDTFARTMGVNEGAHAITTSGSAVGVNVSLGP